MSNSPITANADLVTFTVKSGGTPIKDTYQVLSIRVENNINTIPYCELEIVDGSAASEDFPVSDSATFVPGAEIEVMVGYENDNKTIFKGIVIKHGLSITSDKGSVLKVLCKDKAVKMTVARRNAYFSKTKDSDIISQLIENNGLEADVTDTNIEHEEVIQYYATDWDFMIARAEVNGLVVQVNDGKVAVKNPDEEKSEVLTLTYGNDIYEFEGDIIAEHQYKTVKTNAWDVKKQDIDSQKVTSSNLDIGNLTTEKLSKVIGLSDYPMQTTGFLESDNLSAWAKGMALKSKYAKARGYIKFQGSNKAQVGKLIAIKGMGDRFNGKGFLSGVVHDINHGNWLITGRFGLSPEWYAAQVKAEAPLASGLLPGIQGLHIAKVKQINDDPDEEFRVLVQLPMIQKEKDGIWARLSTFYATNKAGAFFYPEVDDEVIVGFINNDPRFPIILGSVYSSSKSAPESPDEDNTVKGLVTSSKMKVTFNEEKKIITIITPANNQIVFSDEDGSITIADQNDNSIKMSESGIDINSATSVNITAEESINLTANTSITTKSTEEISFNANNINCTAAGEFNAQGAIVTVTGDGQMSLQAPMIMIN